jgi:ABC-2 type transport system ATP-binding protein
MFRLLARLEPTTSGTVEVPTRPGAVGLMPQDPRLPSRVRVDDYLHHIAWIYGVGKAARVDRIQEVLSAVGLLDKERARIGDLSGGMARRLTLAATLLPNPELLLLDEPTVGLDPVQRIGVRDAIKALPEGTCIVVSTHLVEDVRALGGMIVVLGNGEVRFCGAVPDLEHLDPGHGPGETPLERAMASFMVDESPELGQVRP